ncbi:hypothetical protein [Alkalihalophilus marmarensis]|uniref:hypothetical protein n=1 Tax=Alkalihalophilus marmarensis TaxID=521377 RepID=UPI002DB702D3|nr:hypothetical protein [Alkalihalophilus marmarensis]MEC2073199.1 hypothetical protein [Alkalihalophilus marmarensis]
MQILKTYKKYFAAGTFFSLGIIFSTSILIWLNLNDELTILSSVISAFGSLLGGLLGGLVAFAVALSQINSSKESEEQKAKTFTTNTLNLLIDEINHNKEILKIIHSDPLKKDQYTSMFESSVWNRSKFDARGMVKNTTFNIVSEIYRELKDIQQNTLEEYRTSNIDYITRIKTAEKVISDLKTLIDS